MSGQRFGDEPAFEEYEEWMPVTESGEYWRPRTKAQAMEDMRWHPVGSTYSDGEPYDGITHCLKRTVRVERGLWERAT